MKELLLESHAVITQLLMAVEDLEKENEEMKKAISEAINTFDRMRPSSLLLSCDDYEAAHGVSQEYAMSQEAITTVITKLKHFSQRTNCGEGFSPHGEELECKNTIP